jgi:hypothetical protein
MRRASAIQLLIVELRGAMGANEQPTTTKLTLHEFILFELRGKNVAIGRYDTILWRIRSGYLIVVYGSLLLLFGKEGVLTGIADSPAVATAALGTVLFVSTALYLIDLGFRLRQLRVVAARDRLTDIAFAFATGEAVKGNELRRLLHIAGESSMPIPWPKRFWAVVLIFLLYLLVPVLALVLYLVIRETAA